MGVVDLDCIAVNPNSTILYGIGNAETDTGRILTLIFRSNINPANATDIVWKYDSIAYDYSNDTPHYKYPRFGHVDCAVSSSGEFAAFFYNPQVGVTSRTKLVPMGILSERISNGIKLWGSMMYGWTSSHFVHQSFYIEKDGIETIVHAVMDETASVIRFGLVDRSTGNIQLAAVWKLIDGKFMLGDLMDKIPNLPNPKATAYNSHYSEAPPFNHDQRHMVYMNGSIFLYSDATGLISTFPFSSPMTTPPAMKDVAQALPMTDRQRNMVFQGVRGNTPYIGFMSRTGNYSWNSDRSLTMQVTTIDIPTASAPTTLKTTANFTMEAFGEYKDALYLQAISGSEQGSIPFAVGLTTQGYYGISLGGASMGSLLPLEGSDSPIEGPSSRNFRSPFRNHNNQVVPGYEPPSTPLGVSTIFGIVVGVIFVMLFLFRPFMWVNAWLKRTRLAAEGRSDEVESHELIERLHNASAHVHHTSHTGHSPIPGAGTNFGATSTSNTSSHTLFDTLGLSRHPRPNTVITMSEGGSEAGQNRDDNTTP
ncbi:hypothetical protein FBU30_009516 [Linnemannia zychae]|nr:hypothetical protein FBU30_009516 [Linnemannia zychae]